MSEKPTYEELENRIQELERIALHTQPSEEGLLSIMSEAEKLAGFGAWEWDIVRDLWTMSDNWLRIHGYKGKILNTEELLTIAHPEDKDRIQEAFDRCIKHAVPYEIEHRIIRHETKEVRYIRAYGKVENDSSGKPEKLYGVAQDITHHKIAEEMLLKEKAFLRTLLDSADDIIYFKNQSGVYLGCNKAAEKFLGVEESEQVGKSDFDFFERELAEHIVKYDQKVLTKGETIRVEEFVNTPGKPPVILETVKAPIYDSEGEIIGLVGISRDITNRKIAEQERETLVSQLQDKNTEHERFIYTISHDLKSPLVTISGFCGMAQESLVSGDKEQCQKSLDFISHAAKRMEQLIKGLLDLSRAGLQVNAPETLSLNDLFKEAIENIFGRISDQNTIIDIESGLPDVKVDKLHFLQVIENLLTNASNYSRSATGGSHIKVGVTRSGDELICYVKDNGIGIEPQYLDKIFGLFEKIDAKSDGTGVGLAIVKRIIEAHEGRIWVESEGLGHGTTFLFTVPEA